MEAQIEAYIAAQPTAKRADMDVLHRRILSLAPTGSRLWFLDGRNDEGKIVSNPNIGYGVQTMQLAGGKSRDFYRIGLSANTSGLSLYILGLADKTLLAARFGARLGKASVTGYCVKFKRLSDLDPDVLDELLRFGLAARDGHD